MGDTISCAIATYDFCCYWNSCKASFRSAWTHDWHTYHVNKGEAAEKYKVRPEDEEKKTEKSFSSLDCLSVMRCAANEDAAKRNFLAS